MHHDLHTLRVHRIEVRDRDHRSLHPITWMISGFLSFESKNYLLPSRYKRDHSFTYRAQIVKVESS